MIYKKNWQLMKKYLEYRLKVDQITKGSMLKEQTHMRYTLEWAQFRSFQQVSIIRPSFPEYMLRTRLDGDKRQLSAVYIKKILATARLFFTWLSDNEAGYKHIKQSWIKTIKSKRLSERPKNKEAVSLDEILAIAARPALAAQARRARAALVFLYLSGMRIGAFVSLPIQAVDIPNLQVNQFPDLGVRTKNRKSATTYLLNIPELLKVIQDWDNEVRSKLPLNGLWFAPFSPQTGEIDPSITEVGEHRINLARRNFKAWLDHENLPYHSPHKFRHGHIHFGLAHAKDIADFKAVSMNAMHSSMDITDQAYSVLNDDEVKNRMGSINQNNSSNNDADLIKKFKRFLEWESTNK